MGCWSSDVQLTCKCNKWIQFLLCVIDIYSEYAWVVRLKDKKDITITKDFQKILDESNHKHKKMVR